VFPLRRSSVFDLEQTTPVYRGLDKNPKTLIFQDIRLNLPVRETLSVFVPGDNTPARQKTVRLRYKSCLIYSKKKQDCYAMTIKGGVKGDMFCTWDTNTFPFYPIKHVIA
jgi:hypothetical protein